MSKEEQYLELILQARDAMEWVSNNMSVVNDDLQEHAGNLIDNTLAQLNEVLPPKVYDCEDLPF